MQVLHLTEQEKSNLNYMITKVLPTIAKIRRNARLTKDALKITDDRTYAIGYVQGFVTGFYNSMYLVSHKQKPDVEADADFDELFIKRREEILAAVFD